MAHKKRTRLQSLSETSEDRRTAEEAAEGPVHHPEHTGIRAWAEALVLAFVLAMFVRVFIFELYKVPTGSMTPTIIGGTIMETDLDTDGHTDLAVFQGAGIHHPQMQSFLWRDGRLVGGRAEFVNPDLYRRWVEEGMIHNEYHRIFVNKFTYWFRGPERGEIIVFKVPEPAFDPTKPLFIKRAVGIPGDDITFDPEGRLQVRNDPNFDKFEFFKEQRYRNTLSLADPFKRFPYVEYEDMDDGTVRIKRIKLDNDTLYAMGDNTHSSLDSRYWGGVKLDRLKGKAFFRYWPLRRISFLR